MRMQLKGLTRSVLAGTTLLLMVGAGWAETGKTPVQAAGGGAAAEEYAKKSDLGFQWGGDARMRLDTRFQKTAFAGNVKSDPRFRVRLRIGANGSFANDAGYWGFGLATGANNAVSRNVTLAGGDVNGNGGNFGIDRAFVGFKPHKRLDLTVGKMANPYWASDGIFDADLTPEGFAVGWSIYPGQKGDIIKDVTFRTGYYWVRENQAVSADSYAILSQVRSSIGPVQTGVGFYYFGGLRNGLNTAAGWGGALSQVNNQIVAGAFGMDELMVIHGRAAHAFKVYQFPIAVSGDLWFNASTKNIAGSKQKLGWEAQINLPQLGKWNGRWGSLQIVGRECLQFSAFSPWADSELGEGTGYKAGLKLGYTVPVAKNVDFAASYYHYDRFTPWTPGSQSTNRVQLDVSGKF